MKRVVQMFLGLLLLFPGISCAEEGTVINLGGLFNLTGGMAAIDAPGYRGAQLAVKLINQRGGILGGRKLTLTFLDTRTDLKKVPQAAEEIVSNGVVAGLGLGDTDFVMAAAPVFQRQGIPFVTSGATDPDLPQRVGSCLFMAAFGDNYQAHAMADFAYEDLTCRSVVLWADKSTRYTRLLAHFFKERFTSLGGTIQEQVFTESKKDFAPLLAKLKALSPTPDAVFVSGNPIDAGPAIKYIREAGVSLPILGGDAFDCDLIAFLKNPKIATNIFYATHDFLGDTRPAIVSFVDAYTKEFGKPPENAFAALGYDAAGLICAAIQRAGAADAKAITKALTELKGYKGVTGDISFSRQSRVPVKPVTIVGIKDGRYRLVKKWMP